MQSEPTEGAAGLQGHGVLSWHFFGKHLCNPVLNATPLSCAIGGLQGMQTSACDYTPMS
jgi:hypothetical protein